MYSYCASSTCFLACAVRALRAKMSRIRRGRSSTGLPISFSKLRCCAGVSSSSKMTQSAPFASIQAFTSASLPLPM